MSALIILIEFLASTKLMYDIHSCDCKILNRVRVTAVLLMTAHACTLITKGVLP